MCVDKSLSGNEYNYLFKSPLHSFFVIRHKLLFQNNVDELQSVLDTHSGIMSYITRYWRGFYPLLLIELTTGTVSEDKVRNDIAIILVEITNKLNWPGVNAN